MKPVVQILPIPENNSFIAKKVDSTWFETDAHRHEENELILFTMGNGFALIDEQKVGLETGDIFFLGSQLPHSYKKSDNELISAIVIQFRSDCLGSYFMHLPECQLIKQLLEKATSGLQITGYCKQEVTSLINTLITVDGIERLILLLQCLQKMIAAQEYITLSTKNSHTLHQKKTEWIDKIFQFTLENFQSPISIQQVASAIFMSVPSFCHYFKHYTHKTYIDYLNEVRIEYACRLLNETNKPVVEIGYESGYNTIAHFHRQFLKIKKITPLQYRKVQIKSAQTINLKIPAQAI